MLRAWYNLGGEVMNSNLLLAKYIEGIIAREYYSIDNKDDNHEKLKKKIAAFVHLLTVYGDRPPILALQNELSRVISEEGRLDFQKVANLGAILDIVYELKKMAPLDSQDLDNQIKMLKSLKFLGEQTKALAFPKVNGEFHQDLVFVDALLLKLPKKSEIPFVFSFYLSILASQVTPSIPLNIYWNYISKLFIAYVELANLVAKELMELYAYKKINKDKYLQQIITNYESKVNFLYIPSSVIPHKTYELSDNFALEEEKYCSFLDINQNEDLKKIKLIGYAGVGKTTTLEYLEYIDALNYEYFKKLPVVISLITVEDMITMETLICHKLNLEESDIDVVKYLLENNKINLYIDGVNEISIIDYNLKKQFLDYLEEFINRPNLKNLKVIVTDRDNDEVSIMNNCHTYLIAGMTEQDIDAFIEGNSKKEAVEKIKEAFKSNPELTKIAIHPIMLKNFIAIIECGKVVPSDLQELAEVYLEAIIEREKKEKKEKYADYINDALLYLVMDTVKKSDWKSNQPTSYFKVVETFNAYASLNNLEIDSEYLLNLMKKMGILKEVEPQKYAFLDERFFHIYYFQAVQKMTEEGGTLDASGI